MLRRCSYDPGDVSIGSCVIAEYFAKTPRPDGAEIMVLKLPTNAEAGFRVVDGEALGIGESEAWSIYDEASLAKVVAKFEFEAVAGWESLPPINAPRADGNDTACVNANARGQVLFCDILKARFGFAVVVLFP